MNSIVRRRDPVGFRAGSPTSACTGDIGRGDGLAADDDLGFHNQSAGDTGSA